MLEKYCSVNDNVRDNDFVGLHCTNTSIKVTFPLGFRLSDNDNELRKDILLLLAVLQKNTDKEQSDVTNSRVQKKELASLPVQAYMFIVKDFLYHGYYKEYEIVYSNSKKGKINWNRTIKHVKPVVNDEDIIYLDFITKKTTVNENELLTLIHQYCVKKAFDIIGWLFSSAKLPECHVVFNRKLFDSVVRKKLFSTYNDQHKALFRNMLAVINDEVSNNESYEVRFGTDSFHTVWEKMINRVYGVDNLKDYYPTTYWNFGAGAQEVKDNDEDHKSSSLRPDSVMIPKNGDGKIFVLDAKYYKYGNWPQLGNLPKSADINKQITYGEYISEIKLEGQDKVYNAFVLPYDALRDDWINKKQEDEFKDEPSYLHWFGEATSNWKKNIKRYERVQGILLDVKHLMMLNTVQDENEIMELADLILKRCDG